MRRTSLPVTFVIALSLVVLGFLAVSGLIVGDERDALEKTLEGMGLEKPPRTTDLLELRLWAEENLRPPSRDRDFSMAPTDPDQRASLD